MGEGAGEERQPENWFSAAATHYNTQFNVVVQALLTNSVEEHHKQKGTTRNVFYAKYLHIWHTVRFEFLEKNAGYGQVDFSNQI